MFSGAGAGEWPMDAAAKQRRMDQASFHSTPTESPGIDFSLASLTGPPKRSEAAEAAPLRIGHGQFLLCGGPGSSL